MDVRILFLIGNTVGIVLSSGTSVMAASNTTGNNTKSDVGSAKELEKLTSDNSLGNLSVLTTFNNTGSNHTSIRHPIRQATTLGITPIFF